MAFSLAGGTQKGWADAGIVRHTAARPELFAIMDIWVPEGIDGELDWFPVALTR
jgi:hypothetical protein